MKHDLFLLQKLTIKNFMLHQDSSFKLCEAPILLVTGANGSGKTQVVDALLLCLGYHSRRIKKGRIEDLIGAFGEHSEITLEIYLDRQSLESSLALASEKSELLPIFRGSSSFKWKVVAIIEQDKGLNYYIEVDKQRHKVRRRAVRELFYHLSIRADNKLAFTEEGTVNIFTDHSSKNKLEVLLETTGLTEYRENLLKSVQAIEKAQKSVSPLQRKLAFEKEYLQSMEKTLQMLRERKELQQKHEQLIVEEAWAGVRILERECELFEERIKKQEKDQKKASKDIEKYKKERQEVRQELEEVQDLARQKEESLRKKQAELQNLQGQNRSNERVLHEMQRKQKEFGGRLETLRSRQQSREKIAELHGQLEEIEQKLAQLEKVKNKVEEEFFADHLVDERQTLRKVLDFQHQCHQQQLKIAGPLFSHLKLKDEAPDDVWEILGQLLATHAFSFFTQEKKSYQQGSKLLEKIYHPEFFLIHLPKKLDSEQPSHDIWQWLSSDDARIIYIIEKLLNIDISPSSSSDKQILWEKDKVHLNWPAIGSFRSWRTLAHCHSLSLSELDHALQAESSYQQLQEEKQELQEEISSLDTETQITYLKERQEEVSKEVESLQEEIDEITQQIQKLSKQGKREAKEHRDAKDRLEYLHNRMETVDKELYKAQTEFDSLEENLAKLRSSWEEKSEDLTEVREEATSQGERPEEIRNLDVVRKEKDQLEGKLAMISVSPISEEAYDHQLDKVQKLEAEVAGTTEHLEALKQDMEERFQNWHREVGQKIQELSYAMNYLLSSIVAGVRLRIENIRNPEEAGLHIEVQRHGKKWLDLAHLSGGEKVLTVEALILSLHLQAESALHVIDECTQRLDLKFKALAFEMVQKAVEKAWEEKLTLYAPQFVLLAPDTLGVEFDEKGEEFFKRVVLAPAKTQKGARKKKVVLQS